jgi:hypothetical protein
MQSCGKGGNWDSSKEGCDSATVVGGTMGRGVDLDCPAQLVSPASLHDHRNITSVALFPHL